MTIRDDTANLQTMIDAGIPIKGGEYWISRPLDLRGRTDAQIHGATFHTREGGAFMMMEEWARHLGVTNNTFIGDGHGSIGVSLV